MITKCDLQCIVTFVVFCTFSYAMEIKPGTTDNIFVFAGNIRDNRFSLTLNIYSCPYICLCNVHRPYFIRYIPSPIPANGSVWLGVIMILSDLCNELSNNSCSIKSNCAMVFIILFFLRGTYHKITIEIAVVILLKMRIRNRLADDRNRHICEVRFIILSGTVVSFRTACAIPFVRMLTAIDSAVALAILWMHTGSVIITETVTITIIVFVFSPYGIQRCTFRYGNAPTRLIFCCCCTWIFTPTKEFMVLSACTFRRGSCNCKCCACSLIYCFCLRTRNIFNRSVMVSVIRKGNIFLNSGLSLEIVIRSIFTIGKQCRSTFISSVAA